MNDEQVTKLLTTAASAASYWWHANSQNTDDLVQDLWVWYLESPATQKKLAESDPFLARRLVFMAAIQMLSKDALEDDLFHARSVYSADCVREALRGESTNKYLKEILPFALKNLESRNEGHAEAIRRRYGDGEVSAVPAEKMVLSRAVRSVTEEVNIMHLTSDGECIGSKSAVFPETRKKKGRYADPTGDTVVMLDENPEYRHHFYQETPIQQFLGGSADQPAFELGKVNGKVARYRRAGAS